MRLDANVQYVGFGRRLVAGLIDVILMLALGAAVVAPGLLAGAAWGREMDPSALSWGSGSEILAGTLLGVFTLGQVLLWFALKGTPGMLLMGCLVLDARNGRRLALGRCLLRGIGLWLGLLALGAGLLWIVTDPRRQGLHDKLARSVVVKEDEALMELDELAEGLG